MFCTFLNYFLIACLWGFVSHDADIFILRDGCTYVMLFVLSEYHRELGGGWEIRQWGGVCL